MDDEMAESGDYVECRYCGRAVDLDQALASNGQHVQCDNADD